MQEDRRSIRFMIVEDDLLIKNTVIQYLLKEVTIRVMGAFSSIEELRKSLAVIS